MPQHSNLSRREIINNTVGIRNSDASALERISSASSDQPSSSKAYNLRRRSSPRHVSPSPSINSQTQSSRARLTKPVANPLDKLLREKKLADKKGKGIEGLRAAEAVLEAQEKASSKGKMREEMDAEEASDDDDDAAVPPLRKRPLFPSKTSREVDDSDDDGGDFEFDDATKLLGTDEGKATAVNKILASDRKGGFTRIATQTPQGVPLWGADAGNQVGALPNLPVDDSAIGKYAILGLLKSSVAAGGEFIPFET